MRLLVSQMAHPVDVFIHFQLQRLGDHAPRSLASKFIQGLCEFRRCCLGILRDKLQHGVSFPRLQPVWVKSPGGYADLSFMPIHNFRL